LIGHQMCMEKRDIKILASAVTTTSHTSATTTITYSVDFSSLSNCVFKLIIRWFTGAVPEIQPLLLLVNTTTATTTTHSVDFSPLSDGLFKHIVRSLAGTVPDVQSLINELVKRL